MSFKRDTEDRIIYRCDTPHCSAKLETPKIFHDLAERYARAKGWAIGTTTDACPKHHI